MNMNSKIYKMTHPKTDDFYIGATTRSLKVRLSSHMCEAKKKPTTVHKCFNKLGWEGVEMELLEDFPCESKRELAQRERYYFELLKPTLNKQHPCLTRNETIKKYAYKRIECPCGKTYQQGHRSRHFKSNFHRQNTE